MAVCNLVPGSQFEERTPSGKCPRGPSLETSEVYVPATSGVPSLPSLDNSSMWLLLCPLCISTGGRTSAADLPGSTAIDTEGAAGAHCPGKVLADGEMDRLEDSRKRLSGIGGPQRKCSHSLTPYPQDCSLGVLN